MSVPPVGDAAGAAGRDPFVVSVRCGDDVQPAAAALVPTGHDAGYALHGAARIARGVVAACCADPRSTALGGEEAPASRLVPEAFGGMNRAGVSFRNLIVFDGRTFHRGPFLLRPAVDSPRW